MFLLLMTFVAPTITQQGLPKYTADHVRQLRFEEAYQIDKVVRLGDKLFDAFEEILLDPTADPRHVSRVFALLKKMKIDRSQFYDLTLAKLADKAPMVRRTACELLAEIGSEKDGPAVAILLLDGDSDPRIAAANTLATIGGRRDLTAFDLVIRDADRHISQRTQEPLLHPEDVKRYTASRAKLEKRLKDTEAKPPEKK